MRTEFRTLANSALAKIGRSATAKARQPQLAVGRLGTVTDLEQHIEVCSWPSGPNRWTVRLRGELDLAGAPIFEATVWEIAGVTTGELLLDLRELSFIDVAGARAVTHTCKLWAQHGQQAALLMRRDGPVERLLRMLQIPAPDRSVPAEAPLLDQHPIAGRGGSSSPTPTSPAKRQFSGHARSYPLKTPRRASAHANTRPRRSTRR